VAFTLPPLPYSFDALEPHIDAKTMEIHHDKHHGTYVTNLNKALEGHADLQNKSIDDLLKNLDAIPENIRTAVRNNGGGHWNHSLFWPLMKKGSGGEPKGDLATAIKRSTRPLIRTPLTNCQAVEKPCWDSTFGNTHII
jgi:Fe-Mn family superoxide dismutase